MKKLKVNCTSTFFDESGDAQIYYDKIESDTVLFYS
jgi:hypothetical protein